MAVKITSFTPIGTGDLDVDNFTFLPTNVMVRLGPPTGTTDTSTMSRCDGWATLDNKSYDSIFQDATGRSQKAGTDKLIYHTKRVSGSIVPAVEGNLVNFHDNGGGNYGIRFNFTTNVGGYQIRIRVSDE